MNPCTGVAEEALTITITVSPVLYAVVDALNQMLSGDCAPARVKNTNENKTAKSGEINLFTTYSKIPGARFFMRPEYFPIYLFPTRGTRIAVVLRQQFEIENIDDGIVVQVCGGGYG